MQQVRGRIATAVATVIVNVTTLACLKTHVVLSLLCLGRDDRRSPLTPIVTGALLPDAPMVVFFIVERFILNHSQDYIWGTAYFLPHWQHFIDVFNSIPLILLGLGFSFWRGSTFGKLLCLSMLLHVGGDLPLHHDDGHGHFFPFTTWKFVSPVSYWDVDHHGGIVATLEVLFVIATSYFLTRNYSTLKARIGVGSIGVLYFTFLVYAVLAWGLS